MTDPTLGPDDVHDEAVDPATETDVEQETGEPAEN